MEPLGQRWTQVNPIKTLTPALHYLPQTQALPYPIPHPLPVPLPPSLCFRGYVRALIVPRVQVAYSLPTYQEAKEAFKGRLDLSSYDRREDAEILWLPPPEAVFCWPIDGEQERGEGG
jgi:hypothetical protein